MIISCASLLESLVELLVIKIKPHYYDLVFCDNFMSTEVFM